MVPRTGWIRMNIECKTDIRLTRKKKAPLDEALSFCDLLL